MIAIAGGSGRLGRVLASRLRERGLPVRILTRNPDHVPASIRDRAEVATADVRQPASLGPALSGAATVVSAITGFGGPGAAGAAAVDGDGNLALIEAAEAAGVERFVLLSVRDAAPDSPVILFRAKHAAEQRLRSSQLAWTIVRPTAYAELWVDMIGRPLVETGRTRIFGRGRNPVNFVAVDDVARTVEAALIDPAQQGVVLDAVGPENLSLNDLVATVERVTGRSGRVDHASPMVMRLLAIVLARPRPVLADQIRAGLLMDTRDMRVDPAAAGRPIPGVPSTTLEQVVARELGPRALAVEAAASG
jgi:uncharacterized protein YbjT (DUF2867 family)